MIEIPAVNISPALKAFFEPPPLPVATRNPIDPIFADNPDAPTWAIVWESTFGALYPAGGVSIPALSELIQRFREERITFVGLWPDDPLWKTIYPKFEQESRVLDFYDRLQDGRLQKFIDHLPAGTELHPIDENLFERSVNRDLHLSG